MVNIGVPLMELGFTSNFKTRVRIKGPTLDLRLRVESGGRFVPATKAKVCPQAVTIWVEA